MGAICHVREVEAGYQFVNLCNLGTLCVIAIMIDIGSG